MGCNPTRSSHKHLGSVAVRLQGGGGGPVPASDDGFFLPPFFFPGSGGRCGDKECGECGDGVGVGGGGGGGGGGRELDRLTGLVASDGDLETSLDEADVDQLREDLEAAEALLLRQDERRPAVDGVL